ncbi:acetolactate synthase, small subunit [Candidatus Methanoperedens nitroreducens]|uniref:Acetolactate synthase small subunit n=1 Tax=Candidatus Methanoperedens nitratireducens TaxID=1392998 RepID=A0A062V6F5_9EURY|nr:acetolactate synthase small subunit [Candidatus Methanoperedens nitroreducens]KCZ72887.1 acetolactate synthase, small subunit [Candidatus Methanoperedens nitroreducens]MDJ1423185.1 acetolactate synthase small subunit [Candidatus Methanoperedens sp.]
MKHTVAVLVENRPGVLTRVAGLFSRRGFNIESLAVGITENPDTSRMTIVVNGDDHVLEQVMKQLNKLIDVIRVSDISHDETVHRELALIKVGVDSSTRAEVMQIVDVFRAKIVDVGVRSIVVEVTGDESKINAMEQLLRQFGIKEMVRTGKIAMNRGAKVVQKDKR